MGEFRVVVDANEYLIHKRSGGKHPVVCPIVIGLGGAWFPHRDWDDHALVMLDWWLQRLAVLRDKCRAVVDLDFMDGPFKVQVERTDVSLLEIRCIERTATGSITRLEGACTLSELESEIVTAARKVLAGVRRASLWNEGCSKLAAFLDRLGDAAEGTDCA